MIKIREVNDLKEAAELWRVLSPNETIFDEWDFRYCFYKYELHPLRFFAAYEGEELVGLMPLARHPQYGLEFIAEDPSEESRPFVKFGYEHIIPKLYNTIDEPAKCFDISGSDEFTTQLPLEDYKYVLPIKKLENLDNYFKTRFSSKGVYLKKYFKKFSKMVPEINWNNRADLETLFSLNIGNFGEESYLNELGQRGWRDLFDLGFDKQLVSIKISGVAVAASLSIYYKGTYYYLINGVSRDFYGLGNYLTIINIEKAYSLGAEIFDAGLGDCNWKESWHFDKVPQYKFIKGF